MNEIGISKKIKYTLALSMIFLAIVLTTISINMRKTVVESQKETSILTLLKNVEAIHITTQVLEINKNEFLKTGQDIFLNEYQNASQN